MGQIQDYINAYKTGETIKCVFRINRKGTLILLDKENNIIVELQDKFESREAEKYINQEISVNVTEVDEENNKVYVCRELPLVERITAEVTNGREFKCNGTVVRVEPFFIIVKLEGTEETGYLNVKEWRKNAYIRKLTDKIKLGDEVEVCVVKQNDDLRIEAKWILSRTTITTDPWDELNDDVWVEDGTIDVRCVETPKNKTYWWGKCDYIEDIELTGDYIKSLGIEVNKVYRCKIHKYNRGTREFRVTPFEDITDQVTNSDEINKAETDTSDKRADKEQSNEKLGLSVGIQPADNTDEYNQDKIDELYNSFKGHIGELEGTNSYVRQRFSGIKDGVVLDIVEGVIIRFFSDSNPLEGYVVYKAFSPEIRRDPQRFVNILTKAIKLSQRKKDKEILENLFLEYYIFLRKEKRVPELDAFAKINVSAIRYYEKAQRYYEVAKYMALWVSKSPMSEEELNIANAELYYYKGLHEKGIEDYPASKSEFYFSQKYANKIKDKSVKEKWKNKARLGMKECDKRIEEQKNKPKTHEDIIEKYYNDFQYEKAYMYILDLHSQYPDDDDISRIYDLVLETYDRSKTRVNSLPDAENKGKYFRQASAAEIIEKNLSKAEELWKESIRRREPGRKNAVKSYTNLLIREKKYVEALDACDQYQSYFQDVVERFVFRSSVIEIYQNLGAYNEAISEALKIESKFSNDKDFLAKDGRRRLAVIMRKVAQISSRELGKYDEANTFLDRALEYGLEIELYATEYINNCVDAGKADEAEELLGEYNNYLSSEYITTIRNKMSGDYEDDDSLESYSLQSDDSFYEWYLNNRKNACPDEIKEYYDSGDNDTADNIYEYIKNYPGFDQNIKAQMYLNVLAADSVAANLDGSASKNFYRFLSESLVQDMRLKDSHSKAINCYLNKYIAITLYARGDKKKADEELVKSLKLISEFKDISKRQVMISVLLSNNPLSKECSDEAVQALISMTNSESSEQAVKCVEEWIDNYTGKKKKILEKKGNLLDSLENDREEANGILISFLRESEDMLDEDIRHVNNLIEINRIIMEMTKKKDYLGKMNDIERCREFINNTAKKDIRNSITPLALSMWDEAIIRTGVIIKEAEERINVTLAPKLEVSINKTSLYSNNGIVSVSFSVRNEENCAPAKELILAYEDEDGYEEDKQKVEVIKGGELISFSHDFRKDGSFSLTIHVKYKGVFNTEKEEIITESLIVNRGNDFREIDNPFICQRGVFNPMKNIFVGREEFIHDIKTRLQRRTVICAVLYGQKRTGKTSIFKRLAIELSDTFIPCYVFMNNVSSTEEFFTEVYQSFKEPFEVGDLRLPKVNLPQETTIPKDYYEFKSLIRGVSDTSGKRVLLLLDEFSHLYNLRDTGFPMEFLNMWTRILEDNFFSSIITGQETLNDLFKLCGNPFAGQYKKEVDYIPKNFFRDLVDIPIRKSNGESRYKQNSFETLWNLTKGHPYLTQSFCDFLVSYMNRNRLEDIYDTTINNALDEYISEKNEDEFECLYCKYSMSGGEYADEVNSTFRFLIDIAEECSYNGGFCDITRVVSSKEDEILKTSLFDRRVIEIDESDRCEIRVRLFYEWLRKKGKNVFSFSNIYEDDEERQNMSSNNKTIDRATIVNNHFYGDVNQVSGDQIQKQDNTLEVQGNLNQVAGNQINSNISISIDKAIGCLEKLQALRESNSAEHIFIDDELKESMNSLPFYSNSWEEIEDDELAEEKTIEYADRVFQSPVFMNKELTESQKKEFHLTDEVLGMLSPECRSQIVCGIQVYDLIQYCIDNYGMEMSSSESPRGILFARAFENHMKDCMYTTFQMMSPFKDFSADSKNTRMSKIQKDKTTIGTYTTIIDRKESRKALADASADILGDSNKDMIWWKSQNDIYKKIGKSRNDCCHSGHPFGTEKLRELIEMLFEKEAIRTAYLVKEIGKGKPSNCKQNITDHVAAEKISNQAAKTPSKDPNIGKETTFTMREKTNIGGAKGTVFGNMPARISKKERIKAGVSAFEKGKKIKIKITDIDNGIYVVKALD